MEFKSLDRDRQIPVLMGLDPNTQIEELRRLEPNAREAILSSLDPETQIEIRLRLEPNRLIEIRNEWIRLYREAAHASASDVLRTTSSRQEEDKTKRIVREQDETRAVLFEGELDVREIIDDYEPPETSVIRHEALNIRNDYVASETKEEKQARLDDEEKWKIEQLREEEKRKIELRKKEKEKAERKEKLQEIKEGVGEAITMTAELAVEATAGHILVTKVPEDQLPSASTTSLSTEKYKDVSKKTKLSDLNDLAVTLYNAVQHNIPGEPPILTDLWGKRLSIFNLKPSDDRTKDAENIANAKRLLGEMCAMINVHYPSGVPGNVATPLANAWSASQ